MFKRVLPRCLQWIGQSFTELTSQRASQHWPSAAHVLLFTTTHRTNLLDQFWSKGSSRKGEVQLPLEVTILQYRATVLSAYVLVCGCTQAHLTLGQYGVMSSLSSHAGSMVKMIFLATPAMIMIILDSFV